MPSAYDWIALPMILLASLTASASAKGARPVGREEVRRGVAAPDFQKLDRSTPSYDQIILGLGRYVILPL